MSYVLMSESTPKARKQHRCIWCGEAIEVGETYRHEISIFDGNWQNHKWHLECDKDAQEYLKDNGPEFEAYESPRPSMANAKAQGMSREDD